MRAETAYRLLIVVLGIGLAFSLYAAGEQLDTALQSTCTVNSFYSCRAVAQSGQTSIGPIPYWAIGIGGFLLLLFTATLAWRTYERRWILVTTAFSALGVAVSLYFAYVEMVRIGAFCLVCFGAWMSNVLAFLFLTLLWRIRSMPEEEEMVTDSVSK